MKALIAAFMLIFASGASAQQASAYKLLVGIGEGGLVAIDYSSRERCEKAKAIIDADKQRRVDEQNARTGGGVITRYGFMTFTLCIPA